MTDQYLKGQVAIVTGAAQGIGAAIVHELARRGADLALVDVQQDKLAAIAASLRAEGARIVDIRADVTRTAEIAEALARTTGELGRLDILVNNAGINRASVFPEITEEDYDQVMAVNTRATFFTMQEASKHMVDGGRVVNIASAAGIDGRTSFPPYAASKAAVIAMTKTFSRLLAPRKITVNAVAPGLIDTEIHHIADQKIGVERMGLEPGEFLARRVAEVPLGRLGTTKDVADIVSFLCSPAAAYVTGETVMLTGGHTID